MTATIQETFGTNAAYDTALDKLTVTLADFNTANIGFTNFAAKFYGPIGGSQLIYESDSLGNTVRGYRLLCRGLVSPGSQPIAVPFWFENRFNKLFVPFGLDIIRADGQPDNCGCKFTIKYEQTGEVLYEKIDAVCPTAEYSGVCPPNTVCECDCGNMTCCWDANGIPIHSFPN